VTEGDLPTKVTGPLISCEPEIREEYLHPLDDEFLLLASDGLFDVFSSQDVVDLIRRKLMQMPFFEQDPQRVIREVVNEAIYTRQSKDNVTAILVNLTCGLNIGR
jgi:protein phosphatase 2C family protein 2/3